MQHMMKAFFSKGSIQFELKEINEGVFFENNTFKLTSMPLKHGIKTVGFSFIEKDRRRIKVSHIKKLGIPDGPLLGKLQRGQKIKWKGKEIKADDVTYVVKGKKIAYIADTLSCNNAVKLAENADLLISEASFITEHLEKAEGYKHLTAKDAALIANSAGAKKLILTHFSQRYKETKDIEEEAKDYFNDVTCAYDFMKIKV